MKLDDMKLDDWWTSWQRIVLFIAVPGLLILVMAGLNVLMPMDSPAQPVVEAAESWPAASQPIGSAGSFVTLYRVEYEGQVYIVARDRHGAVAIIEHGMVAK